MNWLNIVLQDIPYTASFLGQLSYIVNALISVDPMTAPSRTK